MRRTDHFYKPYGSHPRPHVLEIDLQDQPEPDTHFFEVMYPRCLAPTLTLPRCVFIIHATHTDRTEDF
jgi:hypothetical protein